VRTDTAHYTTIFSGNPQNASPPCRGGGVLMGGGTDVDEAFQWMVEQGGGGDVVI